MAKGFHYLVSELVQLHGVPQSRTSTIQDDLMSLRKSREILQTLAYISSYSVVLGTASIASRWYNEIIADLTRFDFANDVQKSIRLLALLLAFISDQQPEFIETAQHQRLVLFVRGVVSGLDDVSEIPRVQALMFAVLRQLAPVLITVYGDHWEGMIEAAQSTWQKTLAFNETSPQDATLNVAYESLRLMKSLHQLSKEEDCNEDLQEALESSEKSIETGLLKLLLAARSVSDQQHQPMRIVNELIGRQARRVAQEAIPMPESLFPLLAAQSEAIQNCAFELLSAKIPTLQAQISIDLALDEKLEPGIPEELLSLTLGQPSVSELDDTLERDMPFAVRTYCLSWILVFTYFKNAVRSSRDRSEGMLTDCSRTPSKISTLRVSKMVTT